MTNLAQITANTAQELRDWLEANHQQSESVWLVRHKKGRGATYLEYPDIVDELLCYGWVDSLPRALDEDRTMLRISPRNPKSNWSGINKEKVARLEIEGRMQPAGRRLVELAKAGGQWTFLDDVEALVIPPDLRTALDSTGKAAYFWERFPPSSKRGILEWIKTARTATTRAKRIRETAAKAAENRKANFPAGRDAGPKG
ncbi:YdeI family protein [Lewinella sp. 4G2]|uniref:YdeI/OmpD-associated family protein n=1 Tax=Lewinella sp. 4G2 TaxID=1803372 RepID=UPI0007B470FE|nr:YdeI/OmpD-associated family protein [Lewinella sp. 4G2]OAV44557.1 hypothetical protein A3850_008660 [Lewinella sp. 4G2]